jgi:hypothetical protein
MKSLGKGELRLLEWRGSTLSTGNFESQERRFIGGGGVYIGLSKESSRWGKIQNPDKVQGERRTKSGCVTPHVIETLIKSINK